MGRGTLDSFMTAYEDSVEKFRELQPDAVIFVQGIMKVAKKKVIKIRSLTMWGLSSGMSGSLHSQTEKISFTLT